MTCDEPAGARGGGTLGRRVLVALLLLALLLVLTLVVARVTLSSRARTLEARIAGERRATDAEAARKAAGLERYLAEGSRAPHHIDGPALTRFIAGRHGSRVPRSVGPWRVVLHDGMAGVEGVVDLDLYLQEMGYERPASLAGLSGQEIPFSFRGRLVADQGQGTFTVEEVALLGLPLPLDIVERVAGSTEGDDSVLVQRFTLPPGILRVDVDGDRMVINGPSSGP